jgi:hypothetical protein
MSWEVNPGWTLPISCSCQPLGQNIEAYTLDCLLHGRPWSVAEQAHAEGSAFASIEVASLIVMRPSRVS